ncbi:MAG: gliding motility-associated C-terminal domain-containing protein [Ferruginibacter sp.]
MRKVWVLIFFCTCISSSYGQGVYYNTPSNLFELTGGAGNCGSASVANVCLNAPYSIACYKDSMYVLNSSGTLLRFKIGVPGSCQTMGNFVSCNSLTVDKNGIVYMANSNLYRYDPYANAFTNLGAMPFSSAGDLIFFNDKLLMAGSPAGIYELNISNPSASTLYMNTGAYTFYGLVSFPVPCSNSRYFGLSPQSGGTGMIEIDLQNKILLGQTCLISDIVYNAASTTENGLNADVNFSNINISNPCPPAITGSAQITAVFPFPGTITYQLDNGASNTSGYFSNLATGTHTVVASIGSNSCSGSTTFNVIAGLDQNIPVVKTNSNNCDNNNGTISITAASAHVPITYTLLNNGLVQTTGNFTGLAGGTYHFHITDTIGCSKDTSITIIYDKPVLVHAVQHSNSHCGLNSGNISVELNEDSSGVLSSLNNGVFIPVLHYYNLAGGNYYLQVKKGNNCYFDTSIIVQEIMDLKPAIVLQVNNQFCFEDNGRIRIISTGNDQPYLYQLNNNSYQPQPLFEGLAPGNYHLRLQNINGCTWDSFAVIAAYPKNGIQKTVSSKAPTCRVMTNGTLQVTATGIDIPYHIILNGQRYANGQLITGLTAGDQSFLIENKDGCIVDSGVVKLVTVFEPGCNDVFIPNSFSPNGDGINDLFRPSYSSFIKNINLQVYNRYGQLLYHAQENNIGWDGTYKQIAQETGSYVFILRYTDYFGENKMVKGSLMLIR